MSWFNERLPMNDDELHRSERWKQFYQEQGGIGDMIEGLRMAYFQKVGTLKPNDMDGLQALGIAMRALSEIDNEIQSIIGAGKIAQSHEDHAAKIAALPPAKRRFF